MAGSITFVKTESGEGSRMKGKLTWGGAEYQVVTGGYGLGAIPDGTYDIETKKAVVGNAQTMKSGFVNAATGRGWFLPLTPKFSTTRHGFGIHPDGNLPGTKGCVGIQGDDIKKFWDKWVGTAMAARPTSLVVSTNMSKK
ncbi:L,D-transpeptidase [Teredinibacter sp. KSP-S5-2]|uniref:L,D-transpeptidase n=1 Tax=Teredinibacter sp. KSP-S5-2 TaxID=3034506 RepID=UPI0029345E80|nr:L,D-transpeptidase [Teredinibacter sp. KSP-S5-2]WNO10476.1 L,D-transpeptidase [Teredinibacter sp. KSP-S5-2]